MSLTAESAAPTLVVNGTRIDMIERGSGRPLLFLHAENGIEPALAAIDELAKGAHVIAPTHPGYGGSELPKGMRSVDDLSYFYLDLLDQLDLRDLTVVGVSLGAWIA
ncbi:MAG TPA: alpha/beta fold hydrolase, partial [Xanthobacteraceae bacterium]|nr:alpha/beta fold hydrolase [Xanthobacteraceae bacterium]